MLTMSVGFVFVAVAKMVMFTGADVRDKPDEEVATAVKAKEPTGAFVQTKQYSDDNNESDGVAL